MALKKLAFTAKWNTVKDLADKNMKKDVAKRQKDYKDDKEELKLIADNAKEWKQMYANFKLGLTPTLKALENAKTEADQTKYCKDGVKIIEIYTKLVEKFMRGKEKTGMDIANTAAILISMMNKIQADLKKGI